MPILNDELTLWEIAFRWNNLNPDNFKYKFNLPLEVKDSLRLMVNDILNANLASSLIMHKWHEGSNSSKEFFIRSHINDIYACIGNVYFDKKFFKFVTIRRFNFMEWCKSLNAPLPEFWFPQGWNIITKDHYLLSEDPDQDFDNSLDTNSDDNNKLKANQRTKIACQEISVNLWKEHPEMTISDMLKHDTIRNLGGSIRYTDGVVRKWLSNVAPEHVKNRRGRPRKVPK